jgi:hypothetical protein
MPTFRAPVPPGATEVVIDVTPTFVIAPSSPPPVTPPPPPAPSESAVGATITVASSAAAFITGKDGARYTLQLKAGGISATDRGIFRNGIYGTGGDVVSIVYEGNNSFLETTASYGTWRKVFNGTAVTTTRITGPVTPSQPTGPSVPAPTVPNGVDPTVIPPLQPGYVQTFLDEFKGDALDLSKWTPNTMSGADSYTNRPIFDPSNVVVRNGLLHLKCDRLNGRVRSGGIFTREKFSQRYGLFEACYTYGTLNDGDFASFWMVPQPNDRSWPDFGEMDINEGSNREMLSSLHQRDLNPNYPVGDGNRNLTNRATQLPNDPTQTFNIFAEEWTPDLVRFMLNGVETSRIDKGAGFFGRYPWQEPRSMLIQRFILAAGDPGSDWGGSIPSNFDLSSTAKLAWVRVSKRV